MQDIKKKTLDFLNHIFHSYSNILFLRSTKIGVILFCLTLCNLNVFFAGLISIISLYLFIYLTNQKVSIQENIFIYNSLLWSMGMGYFFKLNFTVVLLIAIGTVFTFLMTTILNLFFNRFNVPLFSLPFALVSTCTYIASLKYTQLFSLTHYSYDTIFGIDTSNLLPSVLDSFFIACGYIFFTPNVIIGMIIFGIILFCSRILAFCAVFAFIIGLGLKSLLINDLSVLLSDYYNFNYILTGMSLGGIYFRTSIKTLLIIAVSVSITMLSIDLFVGISGNSIVFTLPFNLAVIMMIFALQINFFGKKHYKLKETPEQSLSLSAINQSRFHIDDIVVGLPIVGSAQVLQAFDGEWTHKGAWRHAYDFIRVENNKSFVNSGVDVTDYYVYGSIVVSPIEGWVVDIVDYIPDNTVGTVNSTNNWGNYVIIQSKAGFSVELSHLIPYSVKVVKGQYVAYQQEIALVGNSGYSTYPHLHMHVQLSPFIGGETYPFYLNFYLNDRGYVDFNGKLNINDNLQSIPINYTYLSKFLFALNNSYVFAVYKNDKKVEDFSVRVCRSNDSLGLTYLADNDGNKLFFKEERGVMYFYEYEFHKESYLKYIYLAMPRVILTDIDYKWVEDIPLEVSHNNWRHSLICFTTLLNFPIKFMQGEWNYKAKESIIVGLIDRTYKTKAVFNFNGLQQINYDNIYIKRV